MPALTNLTKIDDILRPKYVTFEQWPAKTGVGPWIDLLLKMCDGVPRR